MTAPGWTVLACVLALVVAGCGPRRLPPPPPAPTVASAIEAIPGDLDAVVRIDLERMTAATNIDLAREVRDRIGNTADDPGGARLVAAAVQRADTAWFAFRPGLAPELTDNVLVLRGDFSELRVDEFDTRPPWGIPRDLGGGWRRLDRESPPVRSAPARLYRHLDDLLVLVSEAAIDGTELVIERGGEVERVQPPSEGAISVAIRGPTLALLLRDRAPAAARLLARAHRVAAQLELRGRGLTAELEVEFHEAASADQAAEATQLLGTALREQGGIEGAIVERLDVSAVGRSLVIRLALDERDLAVLGAVFGR